MPTVTFPRTFWQTTDRLTARLWRGDSLSILKRLPSKRVHMCVTSPPYWSLRDYRCGEAQLGSEERPDCLGWARGENCAERDWANACHVCRMVLVFREVHRVLRDDGTLWLNYGDTYAASDYKESRTTETVSEVVIGRDGVFQRRVGRQSNDGEFHISANSGLAQGNLVGVPWRVALALQADGWILRSDIPWVKRNAMPESADSRPAKALEYMFMLTKSMDYYFDMEAVRRPSTPDTVRQCESYIENPIPIKSFKQNAAVNMEGDEIGNPSPNAAWSNPERLAKIMQGRNFRNADLWFESIDTPHGLVGIGDELVGLDVTSSSYPGAHFATFGPRLITPCIKAGTSEKGCCAKCGAPWLRKIVETGVRGENNEVIKTSKSMGDPGGAGDARVRRLSGATYQHTTKATNDWEPSCTCNGYFVTRVVKVKVKRRKDKGKDTYDRDHSQRENRNGMDSVSLDPNVETIEVEKKKKVREYKGFIPLEEHPIAPCVVLDPFIGSGTTARVCMELERRVWGIELSEEYLTKHCVERVKAFCYTRPAYVHLVKGV